MYKFIGSRAARLYILYIIIHITAPNLYFRSPRDSTSLCSTPLAATRMDGSVCTKYNTITSIYTYIYYYLIEIGLENKVYGGTYLYGKNIANGRQ